MSFIFSKLCIFVKRFHFNQKRSKKRTHTHTNTLNVKKFLMLSKKKRFWNELVYIWYKNCAIKGSSFSYWKEGLYAKWIDQLEKYIFNSTICIKAETWDSVLESWIFWYVFNDEFSVRKKKRNGLILLSLDIWWHFII